MNRETQTTMESPILRLPIEILQQIADNIDDARAICAFVSSCRQTYHYIGADFVHIQCAKSWARRQPMDMGLGWINQQSAERDTSSSTLEAAAKRCLDMRVFARILDLYVAHYPRCLEIGAFDVFNPSVNIVLLDAVRYKNSAAEKLLIERGAKGPWQLTELRKWSTR